MTTTEDESAPPTGGGDAKTESEEENANVDGDTEAKTSEGGARAEENDEDADADADAEEEDDDDDEDADAIRRATMEEPYFSDELGGKRRGGGDDVPMTASLAADIARARITANDDELLKSTTQDADEAALLETEGELASKEVPPAEHERWAVAADGYDLSGMWKLELDDDFKRDYATYLSRLGFNRVTRGVALSFIGRTTEETVQSDGGRKLLVRGTNPRGVWERTLVASGYPDFDTEPHRDAGVHYRHVRVPITTADKEQVEGEAWWQKDGTVHVSCLRGGKKYGGGDFESKRWLEEDGDVLVCDSVFHPTNKKKLRGEVKWRFRRVTT